DWTPLGSFLDFRVLALAEMGSNVFAGGSRTLSTNESIRYFDGGDWLPLSDQSGRVKRPFVQSLAVVSNRLYAAGEFAYDAEGLGEVFEPEGLLQWDGTSWALVGDAPVLDPGKLVVADGSLFVSGDFQNRVGGDVPGMARLDGDHWTVLNEISPPVFALAAGN